LQTLLKHPVLQFSQLLRKFLDPGHYDRNFFEEGFSMLSMFLRGDSNYAVEENLIDMGWRFRKQCFIVKHNMDTPDQARIKKILCWVSIDNEKKERKKKKKKKRKKGGLFLSFSLSTMAYEPFFLPPPGTAGASGA
jgi:hypothetical protein